MEHQDVHWVQREQGFSFYCFQFYTQGWIWGLGRYGRNIHTRHLETSWPENKENSSSICTGRGFFFFPLVFLGLHLRHMEVPRLGGESELQLPAYATATATRDLSCVCNLHHSSQQCRIPDPPSEARDRTCILMDPSRIHFCCTTMGTPRIGKGFLSCK